MAEKEYISREAAIESFRKNLDGGYVLTDDAQTTHILQSIPAADVRPVVHGKWVYNDGDNIPYCSECMMPQDSECNFCPNCGAKMGGEEE